MFFLQVHSVDTDHPLNIGISPDESSTTSTISQRNSTASHAHPKFSERRGIVHLFRSISNSSLPNPSSQSTILFVVAVPNYLSYDDFVTFCGSRINHVSELLFIRWPLILLVFSFFVSSLCCLGSRCIYWLINRAERSWFTWYYDTNIPRFWRRFLFYFRLFLCWIMNSVSE